MDKETLYALITSSTALEGSTLTPAQNRKLLDFGITSEGKTIAEQLMNLTLRDAYETAEEYASKHELWSSYRVKMLAAKALGSFSFDSSQVANEAVLQKICHMANDARMHSHSIGASGIRKAGAEVCEAICAARPWPQGNGLMGRLLQNLLEMEFGLDPTAGPAVKEAPVPKPKNADRILQILAVHPRYTTNDLAAQLGISAKGVEKHLANLKRLGKLQRIGPDKGGRWQVTGHQA